jgi:hypothetical protein
MPQKLIWSAPRDAELKRLRAEGETWDEIARLFGISRNAAIERGRRIGARLPARAPLAAPPQAPDRPPLPPGHPTSWGAIIAGTLLAETAYPLPVFA